MIKESWADGEIDWIVGAQIQGQRRTGDRVRRSEMRIGNASDGVLGRKYLAWKLIGPKQVATL